jgi:hypothetical protein
LVVINRDTHQQGQPCDINIHINNRVNLHFSSQAPLANNNVHNSMMNTVMENDNQDDTDDEEDNKTITGHESNDTDHDSNYQTPSASDDSSGEDEKPH